MKVHDQAEPRQCLLAVSRALVKHRLELDLGLPSAVAGRKDSDVDR